MDEQTQTESGEASEDDASTQPTGQSRKRRYKRAGLVTAIVAIVLFVVWLLAGMFVAPKRGRLLLATSAVTGGVAVAGSVEVIEPPVTITIPDTTSDPAAPIDPANMAPTLSKVPATQQVWYIDEPTSFTLEATDDGIGELRVEVTASGGIPDWLSVDSEGGTVTVTSRLEAQHFDESVTLEFVATDGHLSAPPYRVAVQTFG